MHKFGSTGLVTGYIKQLLSSFNLPTARIYTREFDKYLCENRKESPLILESIVQQELNIPAEQYGKTVPQVTGLCPVMYIREGQFQVYTGGRYTEQDTFEPPTWKSTLGGTPDLQVPKTYERGSFVLNQTRRLQLKNNIYDSYTHEYLGDYLRFIRDFDGIDLMPLYNCFSNRLCTTHLNLVDDQESPTIEFNTSDEYYNIYCFPVRLFKNYTIAIDSDYPIELCCGLYGKQLKTTTTTHKLFKETFLRTTKTKFNQPFLYTGLQALVVPELSEFPTRKELENHRARRQALVHIASRERELYLFMKVPKHTKSTIVALEGDYVGWNDIIIYPQNRQTPFRLNHTEVSNELINSAVEVPLRTSLQLLKYNTKMQIPFADRLLEYLLDNCITGGDEEVRENVLSAQYLAGLHYQGVVKQDKDSGAVPTALNYNTLNGVWEPSLRKLFYQYMHHHGAEATAYQDLLGYVDKDVEREFVAVAKRPDGTMTRKSLLTLDVWEDLNGV